MRLKTLPILGCSFALCAMAAQIRVSADTPRGHTDCESPGQLDVTGSLFEVSGNSFTLDVCRPTQDCGAIIRAAFSADAPGFPGPSHYLRRPAFLHVTMLVEKREDGCAQLMTVANVESWRGAPDPSRRGNQPYLAVADNSTGAIGDWFSSARCVDGHNTLGLSIGKTSVTLQLHALREFTAEDHVRWTARLLSAGACGSPQGWSFWMAATPAG
jgi:hypothetical protein